MSTTNSSDLPDSGSPTSSGSKPGFDPITPNEFLVWIDGIREQIAVDWARAKRLKIGRNRIQERRLRVALVDIEFWAKAYRTVTRLPPSERPIASIAIQQRWQTRLEGKARKSRINSNG